MVIAINKPDKNGINHNQGESFKYLVKEARGF